jgi:hypothetical protein
LQLELEVRPHSIPRAADTYYLMLEDEHAIDRERDGGQNHQGLDFGAIHHL